MKLSTPGIVWHGKEPVFSADFHRNGATWRLATGGADHDVKIWKLVRGEDRDSEKMRIVFMANLSRHTKAVNVVRFSPNGIFLASAGDDGVVFIWKLSEASSKADGNLLADSSSDNKENWTVVKTLRGHIEDVYDLCWSSDSNSIITGSVDNTAIVWDIQKGQQLSMLSDSKQYVQGVAWDPLGQYVITASSDRILRIYSTELKFKCVHTVSRLSVPDQSSGMRQFRMWIDESLSSFFRRMTFTPDGSLLIVPAGRFETGDKTQNATYIFTRNHLTKPVLRLPGPEKATAVVRCCPVLFELLPALTPEGKDQGGVSSLFSLQYRMVYAVASLDSVLLYDTQHRAPFGYISNIHYAAITDLAWSNDGLTLVITSSDGYCTLVYFEFGELGTPLPPDQLPPVVSKQQGQDRPELVASPTPRQPSTPPQAAAHTVTEPKLNILKPRRIRPTTITSFSSPEAEMKKAGRGSESPTPLVRTKTPPSSNREETGNTRSSDGTRTCDETPEKLAGSAPRRVNFVTLSTFSSSPPPEHKLQESLGECVNPETGQPCLSEQEQTQSKASSTAESEEEPMEVQIIE